ncbi:MAG: hypothetical protein JO316_19230 [Abitibacteriaceae bacterium]|nr:hypothetical protein [Abditibacteriaceae bacterium]MBV9867491.1 hypothetical protein [Abditibacteriaceae bacterium]
MRHFFFVLLTWCSLIVWQPSVQASYIHFCDLPELVTKSDVLAVAEVVKVATVSSEPSHTLPLLRRRATLRVLRSFAPPGAVKLTEGQTIEVEYETKDWSRLSYYTGSFDYPDFSADQVELFPLKAPLPNATAWQLVSHEEGCTLPATAIPLANVQPADGYEFIAAQLAGALANGTQSQRCAIAEYLSWANRGHIDGSNAAPLAQIDYLLTANLNDEAVWFNIFLALYAPWGTWETPHPKIAALLATSHDRQLRWYLPARALSHVNPQGLKERIIEALIAQGAVGAFASVGTLKLNYPNDPLVMQQLQAALEKSTPGALSIANEFLSKRSLFNQAPPIHPDKTLLPALLAAARRVLSQAQMHPHELKTAAALLIEFGTKDDITALVSEAKHAQEVDPRSYQELVLASLSSPDNTLPFWRVVINDTTVVPLKYWGNNWRYCDLAAGEIQRITKMEFGLQQPRMQFELKEQNPQPTITARDQAVAKAKAWLAKHPPD